MSATPPLDPVSVAIAAASGVVGVGAAQYIGPYLVIGLGGLFGALLALRRSEQERTGLQALGFGAALVVAATMVTVPLAESAAALAGKDWKWLAFPIATGVAWVGDGWHAFAERAWKRVSKRVFAWMDGKS